MQRATLELLHACVMHNCFAFQPVSPLTAETLDNNDYYYCYYYY